MVISPNTLLIYFAYNLFGSEICLDGKKNRNKTKINNVNNALVFVCLFVYFRHGLELLHCNMYATDRGWSVVKESQTAQCKETIEKKAKSWLRKSIWRLNITETVVWFFRKSFCSSMLLKMNAQYLCQDIFRRTQQFLKLNSLSYWKTKV